MVKLDRGFRLFLSLLRCNSRWLRIFFLILSVFYLVTPVTADEEANPTRLSELLVGRRFRGDWSLEGGTIPLLIGTSGDARLGPATSPTFTKDVLIDDNSTLVNFIREELGEYGFSFMRAHLYLLDVNDSGRKYLEFNLVEVEAEVQTSPWNMTTMLAFIEYVSDSYGRGGLDLLGNNCTAVFRFKAGYDQGDMVTRSRMRILGQFESTATGFISEEMLCNFSLAVNMTELFEEEFLFPFIKFSVVGITSSIVQMACFLMLLRHMQTHAITLKVALPCIVWQICLDGLVTLFYLTFSIGFQSLGVFNVFLSVSSSTFVLLFFFEIPTALKVWKSRTTIQNATPQQISGFALFVSLARLIIPLHFLLMPGNFLDYTQNPIAALSLVLYVSMQVIILYLQDTISPTFFVPKSLLPEKYDYFAEPDEGLELDGDIECPICMDRIEFGPGRYENIEPLQYDEESGELIEFDRRRFMRTPCNQWMNYKMECPQCRAQLPPP